MRQPYQTDPLHNLKIILRFLLLFYRVSRYKKSAVLLSSSPHFIRAKSAGHDWHLSQFLYSLFLRYFR